MKKHLPLLLAALLALAAGIFVAESRLSPEPARSGAGEALYALTLPTPAGASLRLEELRGKPLVVNFWAPWCPPCVEEIPELNGVYEAYRAKGVQFLGIGIDSARNIGDFTKKTPLAYPSVIAGYAGTELAEKLGNTHGGLPFTVLIDKDGAILRTKIGQISHDELKGWLQATLAGT